MTPDYYAECRALGTDLSKAGFGPWAGRIDENIAAGFTSSEILMALRWTLGELMRLELALPPDLKGRAAALWQRIDAALEQ